MRKPLDVRTLRWIAREAIKSRPVLAFDAFSQGEAFAFGNIAIRCRREARAISKKSKGAKK